MQSIELLVVMSSWRKKLCSSTLILLQSLTWSFSKKCDCHLRFLIPTLIFKSPPSLWSGSGKIQ